MKKQASFQGYDLNPKQVKELIQGFSKEQVSQMDYRDLWNLHETKLEQAVQFANDTVFLHERGGILNESNK